MKLSDLFEKDDLHVQNHIDLQSKEMDFPNVFDKKHDYGSSKKISRQKVLVKDTRTDRVYGARMIWQRDL